MNPPARTLAQIYNGPELFGIVYSKGKACVKGVARRFVDQEPVNTVQMETVPRVQLSHLGAQSTTA